MSLELGCHGRDARGLTASDHACPGCGYAVEMFSDEVRTPCPKCGTEVSRVGTEGCASWCPKAKECLGLRSS